MPRVALTFDDGPGPSTPAILDVLAEHGAHGTFFVVGRNVEDAPWSTPPGDAARARAIVVRALREGHIVGNHTYSHMRPDHWLEFAEDLRRNDELLRGLQREAGVDRPIPVRLPYGVRMVEQTVVTPTGTTNAAALDPRLAVLASLGRTHVHWTADFADWTLTAGDASTLAVRMLAHVEQNASLGLDAVLDLHDSGSGGNSRWGYSREATTAALREFLPTCKKRGIEVFTVPV
jgi:chitin deacetylase